MPHKPGREGIESPLRAWLRPAYWRTLVGLAGKRAGAERFGVRADADALRFDRYPFEPASVFPEGVVPLAAIAEADLGGPPTVRLIDGEVLFVPHPDKAVFVDFLNRHDVPLARRRSVWSALLTPFLDTEDDAESVEREFAWLASLGLERAAVDAWRREVGTAMTAYNFGTMLWEWVDLNLFDVLTAQHARLSPAAFTDFYSRAMRVAALDPPLPEPPRSPPHPLVNALHAVLIEWYPRDEKKRRKDFPAYLDDRVSSVQRYLDTLLEQLTAAYSEPHRRYHTVEHVEHCLGELNGLWYYAIRLDEVRWALAFHDAIYDPTRHDNEARSADWACRVMEELGRPADEQARVRALIMATAHANEPRTADEALLLDIDLSILGADQATFDEYDRAIRFEYRHVPDWLYRPARARILESFAKRDRIYRTTSLRRRYEAAARANLARAIAQLG